MGPLEFTEFCVLASGFGITNSATCRRLAELVPASKKRRTNCLESWGMSASSVQQVNCRRCFPSELPDVGPTKAVPSLRPFASSTSSWADEDRLVGVACLQTVTTARLVSPGRAEVPTLPVPCHKPSRADHEAGRCLRNNDCHGFGRGMLYEWVWAYEIETIFNQDPSGSLCIGDKCSRDLVSTRMQMMPTSRLPPTSAKTLPFIRSGAPSFRPPN